MQDGRQEMSKDFPPIGSDGIALETKAAGEKCQCYFEGYDIVEVLCREQVREKSHVLIIDGQRGAREGSPEEIKFLVTATGTFFNVTSVNPFPVTMGWPTNRITAPPLIAVAAGTTIIIAAPAANQRIVVHYFSISNAHAVAVDVALTFDAGGAVPNLRHRHTLAPAGGNALANLTDCVYQGGAGQGLFAWLAAPYVGGVVFNIVYSIEAV